MKEGARNCCGKESVEKGKRKNQLQQGKRRGRKVQGIIEEKGRQDDSQ